MDGTNDPVELGKIVSWDGKEQLEDSWWSTKEARAIRGSDGSLLPPFITKDQKLHIFVTQLCRYVMLFLLFILFEDRYGWYLKKKLILTVSLLIVLLCQHRFLIILWKKIKVIAIPQKRYIIAKSIVQFRYSLNLKMKQVAGQTEWWTFHNAYEVDVICYVQKLFRATPHNDYYA